MKKIQKNYLLSYTREAKNGDSKISIESEEVPGPRNNSSLVSPENV